MVFTQCYWKLRLCASESTNFRGVKLGIFLRQELGYQVIKTRPQPHPNFRAKEASAGREDDGKQLSSCTPVYRVSSRELTEPLMRTEGILVSGTELSCCTDYRPTLTFY